MAKIIQFPAKSSNAYTNLEQLIAVSDSTASLEQYFEVMAVCDEAGYFLPGEIEKLTEQVRQKRRLMRILLDYISTVRKWANRNLSARLRQPEATTADITTSAHL